MATLPTADLALGSNRLWQRLRIALVLSLMLHVALLSGIPVNPTRSVPASTLVINARLEASNEMPAETAVYPPLPDITPDKFAVADRPVDPITKKEVPKPASAPSPFAPSPSPSAGIDIPLIRDPTYYPAKQLDVYPQPLAEIRLQYPETAGRADGLLLMLLLIDEFGMVNEVSVIEADPPGIFEEAARSVFQAARFSPGVRQGRTVKSRVLIRVKYTYGDTDGSLR